MGFIVEVFTRIGISNIFSGNKSSFFIGLSCDKLSIASLKADIEKIFKQIIHEANRQLKTSSHHAQPTTSSLAKKKIKPKKATSKKITKVGLRSN